MKGINEEFTLAFLVLYENLDDALYYCDYKQAIQGQLQMVEAMINKRLTSLQNEVKEKDDQIEQLKKLALNNGATEADIMEAISVDIPF